MKFINRHQELTRLNRLAKQPEAAVAVVWGRRRVGKTRLLLEWTQKHKGIYYTADESAPSIQRKYFSAALERALPGFAEVEYPDWATLLTRLAKEASRIQWRGPIVIDELPYLISVSSELPSILQKFIDHEAKHAKLIIALCGSSQRMMQGSILDASAPLYGRASEIIKLKPIAAGYLKEALRLRNPRSIVETFAIWGGIPRYWELIEKKTRNLLEAIDQLILDPMGPLYEEPQRLLLEESPPATHLRSILDAIGMGSHRLSEVASRIGQPATSLMRPIQRLIELDLIQREVPYGSDADNSKKALYKIGDPFLRFWFEVVASKRSMLSQVPSSLRIQGIKESLPGQYAVIWEELCRLAVPLLSNHLKKPYGPAGGFWQGHGPEWDILAESQEGSLLIGEAKWTAKTPSVHWIYKAIEELKRKGIPPLQRHSNASLLFALFVPEKPKRLVLPQDTIVIDAKDVLGVLR